MSTHIPVDRYRYSPVNQGTHPSSSSSSHSPSLIQKLYLDRISPLAALLALAAAAILLYSILRHVPYFNTRPTTTPPGEPIVVWNTLLQDARTAHNDPSLSKRVHISAETDHLPNIQQFALATFAPHSRTERHSHPSMTEIFHVKEGKARFVFGTPPTTDSAGVAVGGGGENNVNVGVDDTVAIPAGTAHTVVNDQDVPLKMVYASVLV